MLSAVALGASLVMTNVDLILLLSQRKFSVAQTACPQSPVHGCQQAIIIFPDAWTWLLKIVQV